MPVAFGSLRPANITAADHVAERVLGAANDISDIHRREIKKLRPRRAMTVAAVVRDGLGH